MLHITPLKIVQIKCILKSGHLCRLVFQFRLCVYGFDQNGYAAIHGQDLPTLARPYMDQLSAQVRTSVSLSLYNGVEVISVSQTTGNFIATGTPIGWRASPASSPSGLAILAALPFGEREAALEVIAARDIEASPRRKARIERALAQYESLGYVTYMQGQLLLLLKARMVPSVIGGSAVAA